MAAAKIRMPNLVYMYRFLTSGASNAQIADGSRPDQQQAEPTMKDRPANRTADGRRYLVPEHGFSFADIAMAQVLGFVAPPARGLRIGRNNREAFHDPELAPRYADLVAWRDALYEAHRPTSATDFPAGTAKVTSSTARVGASREKRPVRRPA